jgi:hypothetical protein
MYFDGHNDFMRFVDFIFGGESSLAVVMRKPTGIVGTLFSFDTASLLNAELALSFEGDGSELVVYNSGEKKPFPTLSLNTDNWIVLGFSWSWSNGNMMFGLSIDNETEKITIEGLRPYMDLPLSTHYWGNSKLTQFGLTRLFETFLQVYIHSIHITGPNAVWPPHLDHSWRIEPLWTCAFDAFLDQDLG